MRTPMAGIRVSTELLLHADGTPEERERLLGNLVRETTRITRMVNGLLRIARLDLDAALLLRSTERPSQRIAKTAGKLSSANANVTPGAVSVKTERMKSTTALSAIRLPRVHCRYCSTSRKS
jgi:signal transduction histidine kinase